MGASIATAAADDGAAKMQSHIIEYYTYDINGYHICLAILAILITFLAVIAIITVSVGAVAIKSIQALIPVIMIGLCATAWFMYGLTSCKFSNSDRIKAACAAAKLCPQCIENKSQKSHR